MSSQLVVAEEPALDVAAITRAGAQEHGGVSLMQFTAIFRAHWRMSVAIALAVIVAAGIVTKLMPKTYTAVATLMVNYESADPLAGKEFPVGMLGSFMATQIELMQSSTVLGPVIDRLDLTTDPELAAGNRGGAATLRDWVEAALRRNLEIEQGRAGSQLMYVTASAHSAEKAADIANAVADVYLEQQLQRLNGPASERARQYARDLTDLKAKVAAAQENVTRFRGQTGAIDVDAKSDVDLELLSSLEHRLLDARNALRSNQARASGKQEVSQPVLASDTVRGLRAEEAKLAARMAQLRTELGPNHPQVVELQSQIDANQQSLQQALATYSSAAASDIAVSTSEVAALEKAVEAQRQKVLLNRQYRDQGAKYQLELESAQSVYKRALDGYDQIMFASQDRSSNVTIASRARPAVKADKPKPLKNMFLGTVLGMLLGVAIPFGLELLNRRVRCRDDLERDFGIPVLMEFPALSAPGAGG